MFNGFIVFRIPELKRNVYFSPITYESIFEYYKGKMTLEKQGIIIKAIVLDGRPGVRKVFAGIPIQMCHFHQKQIIRRYLTSNPILQPSIELKAIADTLTSTTKDQFTKNIFDWYDRWESFLKERTTDPITGQWYYTHKRTRSAFRSLKNNLPYLFTCKDYPELNIPNTTNSLDGSFSYLKQKVNIHRGITNELKERIIKYILGN
jgi:hypothetical protein